MTGILELVPATHHDLLNATGVTAFVTIDALGRPQTTAVWYLVDDDGQLKTSVSDTRQKYKNVLANPNVDFFFVDPANPFHTLEIRATAELTPDPEKTFLQKIFAHYGADVAPLLAVDDNRYVVTLTPWRVVTNG